jgi:hypothetical protein
MQGSSLMLRWNLDTLGVNNLLQNQSVLPHVCRPHETASYRNVVANSPIVLQDSFPFFYNTMSTNHTLNIL